METDFVLLTITTLRKEAIDECENLDEYTKDLIKTITLSSTFSEISAAYTFLSQYATATYIPNRLYYIWALVIIKLSEEAPIKLEKGVEYFHWVELFIQWKPDLKDLAWAAYSSALLIEIGSASNIFPWVCKLAYYTNVPELQECFKFLKSHLMKKFWSHSRDLNEGFSLECGQELMNTVECLQAIECEKSFVNMAVSMVLQSLAEYVDLYQIRKSLQGLYEYDKKSAGKCLELILKFRDSMDQCTVELYDQIKAYVGKTGKNPFIPDPSNLNSVQFADFATEQQPFYTKKTSEFTVEAYKAVGTTIEGYQKNLVIKVYSYISERFLPSIDKEIQILTYISNRRSENPLLLEFFSSQHTENVCYLYMEDGGINLMDFISTCKATSRVLDKALVEKWICELVNTFAWLANHRITHRDIKPHNILISGEEGDWKLKIIDFNVSQQADEPECSFMQNKVVSIQGTRGYMAPELFEAVSDGKMEIEHWPGKADVFSLGLTILQIVTFADLYGYNRRDFHEKLMEIVEAAKCSMWVKRLLRFMLEKDEKKRFSFRKCVSLLPSNETMINF